MKSTGASDVVIRAMWHAVSLWPAWFWVIVALGVVGKALEVTRSPRR